MSFTTRPLSELLGIEINGLDLSTPPDDATFSRIKSLFEANSVVVFRDPDNLQLELIHETG